MIRYLPDIMLPTEEHLIIVAISIGITFGIAIARKPQFSSTYLRYCCHLARIRSGDRYVKSLLIKTLDKRSLLKKLEKYRFDRPRLRKFN